MTGEELPRDLKDIERSLLGGPEPSALLRSRVLDCINEELHRSERMAFWQYAAAVAAACILVINLSLSFAPRHQVSFSAHAGDTGSSAETIRQLQLGLPENEIQRQSVLLAAGEHLTLAARPYGSSTGTPTLRTQ